MHVFADVVDNKAMIAVIVWYLYVPKAVALDRAIARRAMMTHKLRNIAERDFELLEFEKTTTFRQGDLRIAIRHPIFSMINVMNLSACCSLEEKVPDMTGLTIEMRTKSSDYI